MTEQAFHNVWMPLQTRFYRIAYYIMENEADAKDAVQELYLKLWNLRDHLEMVQNPSAYGTLLLKNLSGVSDRRAHFTCCIALVDPGGAEHVVTGRCYGTIAERESGGGGFGYDPLCVPDGFDRSFAELSAGEKNAISHRGRALAEARRIMSA